MLFNLHIGKISVYLLKKTLQMEAQYYTPKIEEFNVGFEYEIIVTHIHNGEKQDNLYLKDFITIDTDLRLIKNQIDNKIIRVKCLDEDDILELGWKKVSDEYFEFERSFDYSEITRFKLLFSLNELTGESYYTAIFADIEIGDVKIDMIRLGFENIKNKSELKRIMKMLKIIE